MIVIPEDHYLWNSMNFELNGQTISWFPKTPYQVTNNVFNDIIAPMFTNWQTFQDDDYPTVYCDSNTKELKTWNTCLYPNPRDNITVNSHLCYVSTEWTWIGQYTFPKVKSITLYISSNDLPVYTVSEPLVIQYKTTSTPASAVITIPAGDYTTATFHSNLYNLLKTKFPKGTTNAYMMSLDNKKINNKYFKYLRYCESAEIYPLDNDAFNKYYGHLHTFKTGVYTRFQASMYPVVRAVHIPEGLYTAEEVVDYINSSATQFTGRIDNNEIWIDCVKPFIFNPVMSGKQHSTDCSETFKSSHLFCKVPQSQTTFNSTFKDLTTSTEYTLKGDYTPATLLRHIHDVTGCNFIISRINTDTLFKQLDYNVFTCDHIIDIENDYFHFTDISIPGGYKVINICNLNHTDFQLNTHVHSHVKYCVETDKYTPLTQSSIFALNNNSYYDNALVYAYSNNLLYITPTQCNKLTNSCCTFCADDYAFVTGKLLVNCVDSGKYTYNIGDTSHTFYANEGSNTICVNSVTNGKYIAVNGNVNVDFSQISVLS